MTDPHVIQDQSETETFLADPATHGGAPVSRIETHGAIVFLADDRAFKVKKAVRYPYMDFGTLALREAACKAELELNRRTAPDVYLRAEPIGRDSAGRLSLGLPAAGAEVVEWCVVMRRFRQNALFDRMAQRGELTPDHVERLAEEIAAFHAVAEPRSIDASGAMRWVVEENIQELRERPDLFATDRVDRLQHLAQATLAKIAPMLDRRAGEGLVRHCHGDLHLRNVVEIGGRPTIFDAIEFNEDLAVIDVFYDLAFLLMDLDHCRLRGLGNRVLNRYLEITGGYDGLATLPLFLSTRAAVRAKVSASIAEAMPETADDGAAGRAEFRRLARDYLDMANDYLAPRDAQLLAVGGLSGTGKTTVAQALAPQVGPAPGAVVLRSDVLRKRRFGAGRLDRLPDAAYGPEANRAVYGELYELARTVVDQGHAGIADAVFARPEERSAIAAVAGEARFQGFWLNAPQATLLARVAGRSPDASDADARIVKLQAGYDTGPISWRRIEASGAAAEVVGAIDRCLVGSDSATVCEADKTAVDAGQ